MSHLATWGFIVVAPTSQGGFSPNHSASADDLNAALTWTVAQDTAGAAAQNDPQVTFEGVR